MVPRAFGRGFACGLAMVVFVAMPALVGAHESRDVADGQYTMVVGFLNEPVAVGDKSGLDLRVSKPAADGAEESAPVEGLESTLQAEVYYTDQTMALTIEPRFGQPGAYASHFYPNAVGDYAFRIFGTIEGVAVDETFTSGPDTFGAVEERLLFPADAQATSAGQPVVTSAGFDLAGGLPGGSVSAVALMALAGAAAIGVSRRSRLASSAAIRAETERG